VRRALAAGFAAACLLAAAPPCPAAGDATAGERIIGAQRHDDGSGYEVALLPDGGKVILLYERPPAGTAGPPDPAPAARTEAFGGRLISVEEFGNEPGAAAAGALAPRRLRAVTEEDGGIPYQVVRIFDENGVLRELRRNPVLDPSNTTTAS